ncbi:AAA family ATPase [Metapseudomonas furukawaii]|uniref:AAA family ATPase n=1 Tax=Metapseudomonas furukawaii TaxID=1149133 RepID=UPI00404663F6
MKFVGREKELDALRCAWSSALAGEIQVCVLVAESRLGKTRIVQEFYHWLNQHCDSANYWPDSLPRDCDSLHINPSFSEQHAGTYEAPWLWWGIRWTRADLRNPGQSERCAVLADASHLVPHVESARRLEQRRSAESAALKSLGKTALDLVGNLATGGAAGAVGSLMSIWSHGTEWLELRKHSREDDRSAFDRKIQRRESELDSLSALLLSLVGSDAIRREGLPLVLVLDDVHWADSESLQFIQRLLRELRARSGGKSRFPVKLMILATSWEKEWRQACDQPLSVTCDFQPASFSELVRALEREQTEPNCSPLRRTEHFLARLDDALEQVVAESLPGLTPAQRLLVTGRAGGSPGLLVELIEKLTRRSRHLFVQSDVRGPLTARGEAVFKAMSVDYHDLVEERLQDLDDHEASVLRLASHQGAVYVQAFVQELFVHAARAGVADVESVERVFRRADSPLALVQPIAEQVDEFRLPIYREVLRRQLEESDALWPCIEEYLPTQIDAWLERDRLMSLPQEGRRAFLSFASAEVVTRFQRSEDERCRLTLLRIWAEQLFDLEWEGRIGPLTELAASWVNMWRACSDNRVLLGVGTWRLVAVLRTLRMVDRTDECKALAEAGLACFPTPARSDAEAVLRSASLYHAAQACWELDCPDEGLQYAEAAEREALESLRLHGESPTRLGALARAKHLLATVRLYVGEVLAGIELFEASLAIRRRLLETQGESAERLRDVAESAADLATALLERDHRTAALALLEESLGVCVRIVTNFEPRTAWRENLAEVSERLASVCAQVDRPRQARELLQQALDIREGVLQACGANGNRLRSLSVAKNLMGDLLMRQGRAEPAHALYTESLAIAERALREFGPSAIRLDDLNVVTFKLADALRALDKAEPALVLYRQCLESGRLAAQCHAMGARELRSVYLSHFRIGDMLLGQGAVADARAAFESALSICERALREHGSNYQRLRDVSLCKGRQVDVLLAEDRLEEACKLVEEVLELDEHLLRSFGSSQMRLSDVAFSSVQLGDLCIRRNELAEAEKAYRRALEIEERIAREFESGALHVRRLAIASNRVGNVLLARGEQERALELFQASLGYSQQLIDEIGGNAERLRDVAVAKCRIGEVSVLRSDQSAALMAFIEALDAFERVREIAGSWPQTLDDVLLLRGRVGDLYLERGDLDTAALRFSESLELAEQALADFGQTSKFRGRLALAMRRIAELKLRERRSDEAISLLEEALALLARQDTDPLEDRAEASVQLALVKDRMAEGFLHRGERVLAGQIYRESIELCDERTGCNGVSVERVHELRISRKRLGQLFAAAGMSEDDLAPPTSPRGG